MKKISLLVSFIAYGLLAHGQLLLNENFDYNAGILTGQGGWTRYLNTPAAPTLTVVENSLTYKDYPTSGIGRQVLILNDGLTRGEITYRTFTPQISGIVYFSALVNVTDAKTNGDYFISLNDNESPGNNMFARVLVQSVGSNIIFGLVNGNGSSKRTWQSVSTYVTGTTYLIVVKFDVAANATSLIVNPDVTAEPSTGWITSSQSNGGGSFVPGVNGFGRILLRQNGVLTDAPTLTIDGIRVAKSYSDLFSAVVTELSTPKDNLLTVSRVGNKLTLNHAANGSTVEIYSAVGAKVQSAQLENCNFQLNNLSKGLYVVRFGNQSYKIML